MDNVNSKRKVVCGLEPCARKKTTKPDADEPVKVELKFFPTEVADQDDEADEETANNTGLFIDVEDEQGCEVFEFENLGWSGDYECTRRGVARVLLGARRIGHIEFTLIRRAGLGQPLDDCLTFWDACDADSAALEQIASKFFNLDGSLKAELSEHLTCQDSSAMAHFGEFMYISDVKLEAPYDRSASDENVHFAAQAIEKLIWAGPFYSNSTTATLVMYIPDGLHRDTREYDATLHDMDMRPFTAAGFKSVYDSDLECTYMFRGLLGT